MKEKVVIRVRLQLTFKDIQSQENHETVNESGLK